MTPIPETEIFREALDRLDAKTVVSSRLNSYEWRAQVAVALRERAFFSATVENARVLQTMQDHLSDYLQKAIDPEIGGLKAQGRAEFVADMRELCIREGLGKVDPETGRIAAEIDEGDLTDLRSMARLQLIFDTQTEQANEYGYWSQGNDPDLLAAFPAQRFIRVRPVRVPRPYHAAAAGMVRRKDDLDFWLSMNPDFGVPYGPWGFNSGMGVEDVDRIEAEELGLIAPGEKLSPPDQSLNDRLSASVRDFSPEIIDELRDVFGEQIKITDGRAWWTGITPEPVKPTPPADEPTETGARDIVSILKKLEAAETSEQALEAINLPQKDRGNIPLGDAPKTGKLAKAVKPAKTFIEQIVHKDLLTPVPVNIKRATMDNQGNYRGNYDPATKTANVRVDSSNVVHEISHHLETENPAIYQACKDFRKNRTQGESLQKLSVLTGNPDYADHEEAYEDEWVKRGGHHYMGKSYARWGGQATEILTMGMERLFSSPVEFLKNDPEYFRFLIGLLQKL